MAEQASVGGRAGGTPGSVAVAQGGWLAACTLGLVLFVGINLRAPILAVPPVLPVIQRGLGLSYTATGLLTSLPILVFGGCAWPAGLLVGRLGARHLVLAGLVLTVIGTVLRGMVPAALPLFLFTALLSLGIALAQTAMPTLARQWFPLRIGLVSALFSDGLILGEALASSLNGPLVQRVLGPSSWPLGLALWAVPIAVAVALWMLFAPPAPATLPRMLAKTTNTTTTAPRREGANAWHLGVVLGAGSLIYFAMNGWIPPYNAAIGRAALTPVALGVLNFAQLPMSITLTFFAQRIAGRRWPFILAGVTCLVGVTGLVVLPAEWEPVCAAVLGASSAAVFALGIALPALLAGEGEVARLSGAMLAISYSVAFVGPLLGGALWDHLGKPWLAFVPVMLAAALLVVLGRLLPSRVAFGLEGHGAHDTHHAVEAAADVTPPADALPTPEPTEA